MDEKVVPIQAHPLARGRPYFSPRAVIDRIVEQVAPPVPTVTNYQAIEGRGLRRQTAGGWEWVNPQDCIDCGTGEHFRISTDGYWRGCFVGGGAVLLLALAAIAFLAILTVERLAAC